MLLSKACLCASVNRRINIVVLLMFAAQVLVPIGYMPAAIGSGQYVQLCPTGLGPDVMALLHPQHAANSAHSSLSDHDSHQQHMGHHGEQAQDQSAEHSVWATQCPFGAFANSDVAQQVSSPKELFNPSDSTRFKAEAASLAAQRVWSTHQARAPPLLIAG